MTYGSLAEDASKLAAPANPALKDPARFRLIGKPVKRLDTPPKVDGSAPFGIDVRLPGMVYAVVARCPVFGGKVKSFDAAKAKAVPGVKLVVQISGGVAVVAGGTRYEADALVGADGVNGATGKALGLGGNQHVGVALGFVRRGWGIQAANKGRVHSVNTFPVPAVNVTWVTALPARS